MARPLNDAGDIHRYLAPAAAVLALSLTASACAPASHVRTFASRDCPAGWQFLYTDFSAERGDGLLGRAVCRPGEGRTLRPLTSSGDVMVGGAP